MTVKETGWPHFGHGDLTPAPTGAEPIDSHPSQIAAAIVEGRQVCVHKAGSLALVSHEKESGSMWR
jgi:hypothetical protein